jgi:lactoylglutathione lyase
VDDIQATCRDVTAKGGKIVFGPTQHGSGSWIAFAEDPDGYKIEFIQQG